MDPFSIASGAASLAAAATAISVWLCNLIQDVKNVDTKVFDLSKEVTKLTNLLTSVEKTVRQCQSQALTLGHLDSHMWQQIENALVDCKATVEELDRVVIRVAGDYNSDAKHLVKLLKKPSMHFRFTTHGDEVSDLTKKVYNSNCAMQTALSVVTVSLGLRTQMTQERLFDELGKLKVLVEEALRAAKTSQSQNSTSDPFSTRQARNLENLAKAAQKFHITASSTASTRYGGSGDRRSYSSHWGGSESGGMPDALRERIELWNDLATVDESREDSVSEHALSVPTETASTVITTPSLGEKTQEETKEPPSTTENEFPAAIEGDKEDDDDDESDVELDFLRNYEELAYENFTAKNYAKAEQLLRMAVERSTGDVSGDTDFKLLKIKLALCCCLQEKWDHAAGIVKSLPKTKTARNLPTFHLLQAIALSHMEKDRLDEAYSICKIVLQGKKKILGRTAPEYYESLWIFAVVCERKGGPGVLEAEAARHSIPDGWVPLAAGSLLIPKLYILCHETLIKLVFSDKESPETQPDLAGSRSPETEEVEKAASGHWTTLVPGKDNDNEKNGVERAERDERRGTMIEQTDTGKEFLFQHGAPPVPPLPPPPQDPIFGQPAVQQDSSKLKRDRMAFAPNLAPITQSPYEQTYPSSALLESRQPSTSQLSNHLAIDAAQRAAGRQLEAPPTSKSGYTPSYPDTPRIDALRIPDFHAQTEITSPTSHTSPSIMPLAFPPIPIYHSSAPFPIPTAIPTVPAPVQTVSNPGSSSIPPLPGGGPSSPGGYEPPPATMPVPTIRLPEPEPHMSTAELGGSPPFERPRFMQQLIDQVNLASLQKADRSRIPPERGAETDTSRLPSRQQFIELVGSSYDGESYSTLEVAISGPPTPIRPPARPSPGPYPGLETTQFQRSPSSVSQSSVAMPQLLSPTSPASDCGQHVRRLSASSDSESPAQSARMRWMVCKDIGNIGGTRPFGPLGTPQFLPINLPSSATESFSAGIALRLDASDTFALGKSHDNVVICDVPLSEESKTSNRQASSTSMLSGMKNYIRKIKSQYEIWQSAHTDTSWSSVHVAAPRWWPRAMEETQAVGSHPHLFKGASFCRMADFSVIFNARMRRVEREIANQIRHGQMGTSTTLRLDAVACTLPDSLLDSLMWPLWSSWLNECDLLQHAKLIPQSFAIVQYFLDTCALMLPVSDPKSSKASIAVVLNCDETLVECTTYTLQAVSRDYVEISDGLGSYMAEFAGWSHAQAEFAKLIQQQLILINRQLKQRIDPSLLEETIKRCCEQFSKRILPDFNNDGRDWAIDYEAPPGFPGFQHGRFMFKSPQVARCFQPSIRMIEKMLYATIDQVHASNRRVSVSYLKKLPKMKSYNANFEQHILLAGAYAKSKYLGAVLREKLIKRDLVVDGQASLIQAKEAEEAYVLGALSHARAC